MSLMTDQGVGGTKRERVLSALSVKQKGSLIFNSVRNLYVDKNTAARVKQESSSSSSSSSILQSIFGVTRTDKPRSFSLDAFCTTLTHVSEEGSIWYSVSITPIGASRSNIRCDVYGDLARKQVESQEISNHIKSILESRIREFETAYEALGSPGRYGIAQIHRYIFLSAQRLIIPE